MPKRDAVGEIRVLSDASSARGGAKGGMYTFFHGTDEIGASSIDARGIISSGEAGFFATISLSRAKQFGKGSVVEIAIPESLFHDLWIKHLITQSASHADAIVISPAAQAAINNALGFSDG